MEIVQAGSATAAAEPQESADSARKVPRRRPKNKRRTVPQEDDPMDGNGARSDSGESIESFDSNASFHPWKSHGHLTHPFRFLPPSTTFDLPALAARSVHGKRFAPSAAYMKAAKKGACAYYDKSEEMDPNAGRKLLVTDLNGALLVRSGFRYQANRKA